METGVPILELVTATISLMLIAAIVTAFCIRVKLPFTIMLVAVGISLDYLGDKGLSWASFISHYELTPDFILYLCLPTLIFESAYNLDSQQLKRNITPILVLAIPGLLISMTIIGLFVSGFTAIALLPALLLGAILSATDPVAVVSLFKKLGAPERLTILVEGESLMNDATSLVAAKVMLMIIAAGAVTSHNIGHGFIEFFTEFFGGLAFGWLFARFVGWVLGHIKGEPEIEICLTTVLAYASFIIADDVLHVSGVLAVVAAGLTMGNWGQAKLSPSVSEYLNNFWEFAAYLANAVIFLLVGLSINLHPSNNFMLELTVVIIAMLVSRAVIIYGLIPITRKMPLSTKVNIPYQTIMWWGGLRGAIALAIVLGLKDIPEQGLFIDITTGAVLFTLFVQGLSIEKLLRKLGLDKLPLIDRFIQMETNIVSYEHAEKRLQQITHQGLFSPTVSNSYGKKLKNEVRLSKDKFESFQEHKLDAKKTEQFVLLNLLTSEDKQLYILYGKGFISESAYRNLHDMVKAQVDAVRYGGGLSVLTEIRKMPKYLELLYIKFLEPISWLSFLSDSLRTKRLIREYEEVWALHECSNQLIEELDKFKIETGLHAETVDSLKRHFNSWNKMTKEQLDKMAEDFPSIILDLQKLFTERAVIQSRIETIDDQAHSGRLPESLAKEMKENLNEKLNEINRHKIKPYKADPYELLNKAYIFDGLSKSQFKEIYKMFNSYTIGIGHEIIRQGDKGSSMYFIAKGVVRVFVEKDGKQETLASLLAGDFIGEIALIRDVQRTATCRATTPCVIYELKRSDFEKIKANYPTITDNIEKVADERSR